MRCGIENGTTNAAKDVNDGPDADSEKSERSIAHDGCKFASSACYSPELATAMEVVEVETANDKDNEAFEVVHRLDYVSTIEHVVLKANSNEGQHDNGEDETREDECRTNLSEVALLLQSQPSLNHLGPMIGGTM